MTTKHLIIGLVTLYLAVIAFVYVKTGVLMH